MGQGPERGRIVDIRIDWVRFVLAALVVAAIVWFAVTNRQSVTITWWLVDVEARLIFVILVSAALGAIAGALLAIRRLPRALTRPVGRLRRVAAELVAAPEPRRRSRQTQRIPGRR